MPLPPEWNEIGMKVHIEGMQLNPYSLNPQEEQKNSLK